MNSKCAEHACCVMKLSSRVLCFSLLFHVHTEEGFDKTNERYRYLVTFVR